MFHQEFSRVTPRAHLESGGPKHSAEGLQHGFFVIDEKDNGRYWRSLHLATLSVAYWGRLYGTEH